MPSDITTNSTYDHNLALETKPGLLVRHTGLQVIILALRVLQAVLTRLHVLALVATQSLHCDVDQAIRGRCWLVTGKLPPHSTTEGGVLDILDLLARHLRRVV